MSIIWTRGYKLVVRQHLGAKICSEDARAKISVSLLRVWRLCHLIESKFTPIEVHVSGLATKMVARC